MHPNQIKRIRKRIAHFRQRLETYLLPDSIPFKVQWALADRRLSFGEARTLSYRPIEEGTYWGKDWQCVWFRLKGEVPQNWQGKEIVAHLNFGGEALIFSSQGLPLQGLTNRSVFDPGFKRDVFPLFSTCRGNERVELWVEATSSGLFGLEQEQEPDEKDAHYFGHYEAKLEYARLALFDRTIWHLMLDVDILTGLLAHLPENSVRFARILDALNRAVSRFGDLALNAPETREILQSVLQQPACASELTVFAVGHAHIDTAWLWPIEETIRKCARTFATQVSLLKEYPEFVFGASQPQHYWFVKKYYPELYEEIHKFVNEGRWELQGGMWVEADCNLISGESMVRQILHGKNFFMDEFGIDVKNLWLPDVFGYSAALPQILRKSGIEYFLTQKLSWNPINEFPHTTFLWQGIDGTRVLAHFPPENVYHSPLDSDFLISGREHFREKAFMDEFISLFGVGDGGGGPKPEYIEYGRRLANLEGVPKVRFAPAHQFFRQIERYRDRLSVWDGELFLEMHLGTLTAQAQVKKYNRLLEFDLRLTEMLWSALPLERYPQETLDALWKTVLVNQFHDILPGSSIHNVYEHALTQYAQVRKASKQLQQRAAEMLFEKSSGFAVVVNPFPFEFSEIVTLPGTAQEVRTAKGEPLPIQPSADGSTLVQLSLSPLQTLTLQGTPGTPEQKFSSSEEALVLENTLVRYEFSADGQLVAAFDKEAGRKVMEEGQRGNVLQLFVDRPTEWDAWEVDPFYEEQTPEEARAVSFQRVESGPLRHSLKFEFRIGHSHIEQTIRLRAHSKRLDFETRVNWQENHRMLRVNFECAVRASEARFDIQFGYLARPTHRNTSWDEARYESVGHKYADLSLPDYGVALLNDSKYGYRVSENALNLNLLRAPTYPDPECDRGEHTFVYALLPHVGDLPHSNVMQEAWLLNQPPVIFEGMRSSRTHFLPFVLQGQGVRLEAVKKAEKESCLVVRLVEEQGMHNSVQLIFEHLPLQLVETDLMEWRTLKNLQVQSPLQLSFNPFEIRTFKLYWTPEEKGRNQ